MFQKVLGQLPPRKIETLTFTRGQFFPGQLPGCPPTLKLTLTLTKTPNLTGDQFSSGGNGPDTVPKLF